MKHGVVHSCSPTPTPRQPVRQPSLTQGNCAEMLATYPPAKSRGTPAGLKMASVPVSDSR